MSPKPISPTVHGIIDYAFILSLLTVPSILKLHKRVRLLYVLNAISVASYTLFTKYPVAVKPVIPFYFHKRLDIDNLAALLVETLYKKVGNDKRAFVFHFSMLTAGVITVLLTNWGEPPAYMKGKKL